MNSSKTKIMKKYYLILIFFILISSVFCFNKTVLANADHIVISEIQLYGQTSKDDFVELYNPTDQDIVLDNWNLKKKTKSGNESTLVSTSAFIGTIPSKGFFLITHKTDYKGTVQADITFSGASYSIASNNTILIYNSESILIDKVGMGEASDFERATSPNPDNGKSIERKPGNNKGNGQDTDNNLNDFLDPAEPNPQNSESDPIQESDPDPDPEKANILINEIAWMGSVDDYNNEWIELWNNASSTAIIDNWTLKISEDIKNLLGSILPGDYFILNDLPNLNNSGENLELRDNENNLISSLNASSGWPGGDNDTKQTLERKPDNTWQTSLAPGGTPGSANSAGAETDHNPPDPGQGNITSGGGSNAPVNQSPIANAGFNITGLIDQEISFDAKESFDPDGDTLTYFWNFGDGAVSDEIKIMHVYEFPGQYIASLTVSDSKLENTNTIIIDIYPNGLNINEFSPDKSWVEIYNDSENIINLANYQLNDFIFSENSLISPYNYLVISYEISQITLEDYLIFSYPNQQVIQEVQYNEARPSWSINRINDNEYVWSNSPTPGTANLVSQKSLIDQGFGNNGVGSANLVLAQDSARPETFCNESVCNVNPVLAIDSNERGTRSTAMNWRQIQVLEPKKAWPIKAQANSGLISLWVSSGIAIVLLIAWWGLKLGGKIKTS
ncbi:hypothetical protein CL633_02515 [bacterium]|nr:hypothetical protein [bacterium]